MSLFVSIHHRYPSIKLDIEFELPLSGVTAVFGPSGSGKSTIINATAGLLRPEICRIQVGGKLLADTCSGVWLPPEQRRVGLVFQDSRLFPHMSVATNLRFGMRRVPPGPIIYDEIVDLLGLGAMLHRRPLTLSSGERQRVAIGRALLSQPHLLLMDEPLASLDATRKAEILPFLMRLRTALRLPVLYVTHALDEIARLADFMVLIEAGQVLGFGSVSDVAVRADLPLAQRDDASALLVCRIEGNDQLRALTRLQGAGTMFWVPLLDLPVGSWCRIRVPAREVILTSRPPEAISLHNVLSGTVKRIVDDISRHSVVVEVALPEGGLLSRVTPDAVARLNLSPGSPILALIKSTAIEVLTYYKQTPPD